MANKPTYEELEQRVKELEEEVELRGQVERDLAESEERFRAFTDNIPASVYIKDENNRHTYGNPVALASVGRKPEEFFGSTTRDLWPPEVAARLTELDQRVLKENIPRLTEEWRNTAEGDTRWIRDIKFPIRLPSGKKLLGGIAIDITAIKQSEQELREAYNEIKGLKAKLEQENVYLRERIEVQFRHDGIVGESREIRRVLKLAEKVAKEETTILVLGETGTGKEVLAYAIHNLSTRREHPMVTVNCAALPPTLIESELFGQEKGAFTGALSRRSGRFETADGSTIFLDEIGDLPLDLQAKLLRVLHEGKFERLGSSETVSADVRVIAATNRDLARAVREGKFRRDLYYRLNVFPITIPPLRERREDIPLLVWAFVREYERSMGKRIEKIKKTTMDLLCHYSWPGNVRELRNVIERAMILSEGSTLHINWIETNEPLEDTSNLRLEDVERRHVLQVLERTGWRVSGSMGAAEILDLKPTTLEARMKKLGIRRPA
jgi:PAS domain S-box-containing protein